jgi:hypothetical protein
MMMCRRRGMRGGEAWRRRRCVSSVSQCGVGVGTEDQRTG